MPIAAINKNTAIISRLSLAGQKLQLDGYSIQASGRLALRAASKSADRR
jgi:hypothetical protein